MVARSSQLTTLSISDAGDTATNYTAIAQIESISGPSLSNPTLDVSDLDATARNKISSGLVDGGQVSIGIFFDPNVSINTGTHDDLVDRAIDGTTATYKITWPSASKTVFPAAIVGATPISATGEALKGTLELDITGAVVFTA